MNCPNCKSNHTKTCAAAYQQGSRWGHYQTLSELAVRCAPPRRKSLVGVLGRTAFFLYIFASLLVFGSHLLRSTDADANGKLYAGVTDALASDLLAGLAILISALVFIAIPRALYNRSLYVSQLESWKSKWVCLRCSYIYDGPQMKIT